MCTSANTLNRSSSESDLFNGNFESTLFKNPIHFEKSGTHIRKVLYIEETVHSESPTLGIKRSLGTYTFLGTKIKDVGLNSRSMPDDIHTVGNSAESFVLNDINTDISLLSLNKNKQFYDIIENSSVATSRRDFIPMEVDNSYNTSTEGCATFEEDMDIDLDTENYISDNYSNLEDVLKNRNYNKTYKHPHFTETPLLNKENEKAETTITVLSKLKRNIFRCPTFSRVSIFACTLIIVAFLYIRFFSDNILFVSNEDQCRNIREDLLKCVHGQETSINAIIKTLCKENWQLANKIKVLSFIGSTGVGKTFVANIVKRNFQPELAHELYGLQLNYKNQWIKIVTSIQSCCLNLIVIDDLKRPDTTDLFSLIYSLPQDQSVLVIPIFNIQYTSDNINHMINYNDIKDIRSEFDRSGLHHDIIIFNEFNNDQVKDWIVRQLKVENVTMELYLQEKMLTRMLSGYESKYRGLKGLHSKLYLELERYKP